MQEQSSNRRRNQNRNWDQLRDEELAMSGASQLRKAIFSPLGNLKEGGRIKKTGIYRLHRGERVIPAGRGKSHRGSSR
jgi:hypothetical protein